MSITSVRFLMKTAALLPGMRPRRSSSQTGPSNPGITSLSRIEGHAHICVQSAISNDDQIRPTLHVVQAFALELLFDRTFDL
jgi:hypothetical protein